jgi:hypothetical protein
LLKLMALRARSTRSWRPRLDKARFAAQAVGEMTDGERIGFGGVYFMITRKFCSIKPGPCRPEGAEMQSSGQERLVARTPVPAACHIPHTHRPRAIGEQEVEAIQHHQLAPRSARAPSASFLNCWRSTQSDQTPDRRRPTAVTVEIDGKPLNEVGMVGGSKAPAHDPLR